MMLEESKLFHERYLLIKLLGRGGFSEVWLAEDTRADGMLVAVKVYASGSGLDENGTRVFSQEFSLVFNLNHTNLLRPVHYELCDQMPYLILPYCEKGSTAQLTGNMTEDDVWKVLHDVAAGLAFLHSRKPTIIHQDVKPDNILVNEDGDFMLTDFGISARIRNTLRKSMPFQAFTSGGTLAYMGPERFSANNQPVMASDVWALGATVYELMTCNPPFGDHGGLLQQNGAATPDVGDKWSTVLRQIVTLCLSKETWDRPIANTLVQWTDMYFSHARHELEKVVGKAEDNVNNKPDIKSDKKKYFPYIVGTVAVGTIIALLALFSFMKPNSIKSDDETMVVNTVEKDSEPLMVLDSVEVSLTSEYEKIMADAGKAFYKETYANARALYESAYKIASNDAERNKAKDGIYECLKFINLQSSVTEPLLASSEYITYMQNGERLFNAGRYREALNEFNKASKGDATPADKQAAKERVAECNRRVEAQIRDALQKAKEVVERGDNKYLDAAFIYYKQAKDLGTSDLTGYNTYMKIANQLIVVFGENAGSNEDVKKCLQYAQQLNNTSEVRLKLENLGLNN